MPPSSRVRRHPRDSSALSKPLAPDVPQLFVDPMLGAPLQIYVDSDVPNRQRVVEQVKQHGGCVATGYSAVPYILVDPTKESGQSLFLQYVGKKGKVVLDASWVSKCIDSGQLQSYQTNFAGCKVTGEERPPENPLASNGSVSSPILPIPPPPVQVPSSQSGRHSDSQTVPDPRTTLTGSEPHDTTSMMSMAPLVFSQPSKQTAPSLQPSLQQSWRQHTPLSISTSRPPSFVPPPPTVASWTDQFDNLTQPSAAPYDYHYRPDEPWHHPNDFYGQQYDSTLHYPSPSQHFPPPVASSSVQELIDSEPQRKKKRPRSRTESMPKKPRFAVSQHVPERSPTPPTRVLKSTHGGNHFTEEDVKYLSRYIDYCRAQGLPMSLREICERLAIKAPHHTFYSWRRYCNKHQIRLGGYAMENPSISDESETAPDISRATDLEHSTLPQDDLTSSGALMHLPSPRTRSPSPPRMLFRSTTGKGVAFTAADVTFLVRYLDYWRGKEDELDMVQFWKRVAEKAPHHSRASWMKYWRRHKHELEGSAPPTQRPDKKRKYDFNDDLLLAKYFLKKPTGTSDSVFQTFARENPHHPWKGWQEHHRIHKAKIDHLIQQLGSGEIMHTSPSEG